MSNRWFKAISDAQDRFRRRRGIPKPVVQPVKRTSSNSFADTSSTTFEEVADSRDPQFEKLFQRLENQQQRIGPIPDDQIPLSALKKLTLEIMEELGG